MKFLKKTIFFIVIFFSASMLAYAAYPDVKVLLNGVKTTVTGNAFNFDKNIPNRILQTNLTGASAVSAVVRIDGSLDGTLWANIGTMSVASTPVASQVAYLAITSPWSAMRAVVSGITSTAGATSVNSAVVTTLSAE